MHATTTVKAPTCKKTSTQQDTNKSNLVYNNDNNYSDLEYLQNPNKTQEMDNPVQILLLGSTFDSNSMKSSSNKNKITINYVAGSLE